VGTPIAVLGDKVVGICLTHLIPSPVGAPMPSPPLPFSAPLTLGLCPTVLVSNKPVAVVGSSGLVLPPHVGLHPTDPFLAPPLQKASVLVGSPTVLAGGAPIVRTGSTGMCCGANQGTVAGTGATVLVA
jgi:uncharacterized Zn-binding protein involved in type VI secretion